MLLPFSTFGKWAVKNGLWILHRPDQIWGKGCCYELWIGTELVCTMHEVDLRAMGLEE